MRKLYLLFFVVLLYRTSLGQFVDVTFQGSFTYKTTPEKALYLPDGKYILWNEVTSFASVNGQVKRGIVRFNADGTVDNTFQSGVGVVGTIKNVARQSDGKLIIIGRFSAYNGQAVSSQVIRLNADGTIDNTFNPAIQFSDSGITMMSSIQPDGKILVMGPFSTIGGVSESERLIRLNTDGTRDQTFNAENNFNAVSTIAFQSDGKFILGGSFTTVGTTTVNRIARFNTNGTLDNTFSTGTGFDATVQEIKVTSTGRILVAGAFTTYNGAAMKYLVALTSTGAVDGTFTQNGTPSAAVSGLALQSDGKVVIAGQFWNINGTSANKLARLQVNGAIDATFATNIGAGPVNGSILTFATVNAVDDILILGYSSFSAFNNQSRNSIALLEETGALKGMSEALTLEVPGSVSKVVRQGSQLLVAHGGTGANGLASSGLERMNEDGTLDATFRSGLQLDNRISTIFLDANGNILIGGYFTTYKGVSANRIARLDANGNIDNTFRTNTGTGFSNSDVNAIAQQADGKLIVGGSFDSFNGVTRNRLVRLNTNGTIDNTFNAANGFSGGGTVKEIKIQPDGKILVGGEFASFAGNTIKSLVRLNADGTLDNTFQIGTGLERSPGASSAVYAIHVLDNGKILIGGSFEKLNGVNVQRWYIRLNANGTLDTQLGDPGFSIVDSFTKLANGQILVTERAKGLSRLNSDGTLDVTFSPVSTNGIAYASASIGNNVYIGGTFSVIGSVAVDGIAKVTIPSAPAAPTALNATAPAPTQVALTWQDNSSNESGFAIERSLTSNANFAVITTRPANTTTYTDNTATGGTTYYYRVRAYNAGDYSGYSNVKEIATPQSIPTAPAMAPFTVVSSSALTVKWWDQSNNEQNFLIKRSVNNTDFTLIATLPANTTSYEDTGLTPGTRYYYRISAVNTAGESAYTSGYELAGAFKMTAGTIPACGGYLFDPGGEWANYAKSADITTTLQPDAAGSSITLTFESFNTVATYDVLSIYDGSNTSAPLIGTYSGSQLPPKVRASNVNGTITLRFQSSTQTPLAGWKAKIACAIIPFKPSDVNLSVVNTNQVNISWTDNATNEAGYEVDRSVGNNTNYVRIATLDANATQYSDNVTEREKTYYYRVRAKGTTEHSDYTADKALAYGDGGVWMLKKEFSGPARTDAIAFGLGQKGYVGTGLTGAYAFDMRSYDQATDTWATAAAFGGSSRAEALSFVIGSKAYVGMGEDGFGPDKKKDLWEYNDQTNAWTQRADFPGTIRRNAMAFVINGKAYVGGGVDDTGKKNDFYEYDPATNTWAPVAAFPGDAREGAVAFSIGGDGYVGTGRTATARTKDFWKYTAATNTWARVADFPGLAREEAVAFVVDGKAYVGTGESGNEEKDFYRYDAATNAWTKVVSFGGSARAYATSFSIGTKGYVATGFDGSNLKDVWEFTATATIPTAPAAPSALSATVVSGTTIDVSWTDNTSNETGFVLERSATDESNYIAVATLNADVVSYSDNSLTASTKYFYRVKAVTASEGNSPYAASVSATTLPMPPQAPGNLAAVVVSHTSIRLTWTDNSNNETQFVIERSLSETGTFVEVGTAFSNAVQYNNIDLASSTTYYYRIKAKNTGGSSAYTSVVSATTLVSPVAAPSSLMSSFMTVNSVLRVKLQWLDNANNETGFQVQRAITGTQNYFTLASLAANITSYEDATITEGANYSYRVRAIKGTDFSGFSAETTITIPRTVPAAPLDLTAELDENMTVAYLQWWRNSTNEDGFIIERSINGGPFIAIDTVTSMLFEDSDLTKSLTVSYRVYAYNTAGKSAASNIASLVTTGVEADQWSRTLGTYPNPVKDDMTIEINDAYRGAIQFSWYNLQGQLLKSDTKAKTTHSERYIVNARDFNAGVLMLKVTMGNLTVTRKVVIQ